MKPLHRLLLSCLGLCLLALLLPSGALAQTDQIDQLRADRDAVRADRSRAAADLVIDTSDLNVHQLKDRLVHAFAESNESRLQVSVESFGFKHGLPLDADMVLDVRFLPNPHWIPELKPLTGHERCRRVVGGANCCSALEGVKIPG